MCMIRVRRAYPQSLPPRRFLVRTFLVRRRFLVFLTVNLEKPRLFGGSHPPCEKSCMHPPPLLLLVTITLHYTTTTTTTAATVYCYYYYYNCVSSSGFIFCFRFRLLCIGCLILGRPSSSILLWPFFQRYALLVNGPILDV